MEDALDEVGVDTVERIPGDSPAATSADLKAALEANATVNRLFFVRVDNQFNGTVNTCRAANDKLRHADLPNAANDDAGAEDAVNLSGGSTTAAIEVAVGPTVR